MAAVRRHGVRRGADRRQRLRIALERQAFADELLTEIAGREFDARDLVDKADILVAAGKQPKVIALAECSSPNMRVRLAPSSANLLRYGAALLPMIWSQSLFSSTTMMM